MYPLAGCPISQGPLTRHDTEEAELRKNLAQAPMQLANRRWTKSGKSTVGLGILLRQFLASQHPPVSTFFLVVSVGLIIGLGGFWKDSHNLPILNRKAPANIISLWPPMGLCTFGSSSPWPGSPLSLPHTYYQPRTPTDRQTDPDLRREKQGLDQVGSAPTVLAQSEAVYCACFIVRP